MGEVSVEPAWEALYCITQYVDIYSQKNISVYLADASVWVISLKSRAY
jgi:hypothetical protein